MDQSITARLAQADTTSRYAASGRYQMAVVDDHVQPQDLHLQPQIGVPQGAADRWTRSGPR